MAVAIKRILLDALKPRESSIIDLSKALGSVDGVEAVDIVVSEVDAKTETIKVTIRGLRVNYEDASKVMDKFGVSIRGVDEISVIKT